MSLITEEYINDTSPECWKDNRLNILKHYISYHGKNPTDSDYKLYTREWYSLRAKVKCSNCEGLLTNGSLTRHYQSKKCKTQLLQ